MSKTQQILGVDIGGVILSRATQEHIERFRSSDRYLETPKIEGAVEGIRRLALGRFGPNIHLVSRINKGDEDKMMSWLRSIDFFMRASVIPYHVHFCEGRHEKQPICKSLGITHFIDDRSEILVSLKDTVEYLFLFNPDPEEVKGREISNIHVRLFNRWDLMADYLLAHKDLGVTAKQA